VTDNAPDNGIIQHLSCRNLNRVESLLTKMLIHDAYSVTQLEEAITWFQQGRTVSCPFEQTWSRNLADEIVRQLRSEL
jgi:hypothetical protein